MTELEGNLAKLTEDLQTQENLKKKAREDAEAIHSKLGPYQEQLSQKDDQIEQMSEENEKLKVLSTKLYYTIQYNTIQYNTIQYNTIQYNTIQYNTIQYNTIQYNMYSFQY